MPYQKTTDQYAQKKYAMPSAYQGGAAQAAGCGCGGAPSGGSCLLAAPLPAAPACMPAAFTAGCCSCQFNGSSYHKMKSAYGY